MSQIKISDLVETTSVDEELCMVPVDDGTATKKISLKNLSASATESAETYALAAAGSASSASDSAAAAAQSSSDAGTYATNAAESAIDAQGSASSASSSADQASASASNASASAGNAAASATSVAQQVASAEASATLARSWAEGGTGARAGEDTNNAKHWAEVAASMHDGVASFNGRQGIVTPASGDYSANMISRGTTSTVDADLTKVEIVNSNIAPSEDGDTASQGYSIGDQFLRNGTLYKAKTAIVAGDTFVLDTNYEAADKLTKQIKGKEDAHIILTQTLIAGSSTLIFTDASIGNNSRIKHYSDPFIVGLVRDMVQSGTTITVTCKPQQANVSVQLEISN